MKYTKYREEDIQNALKAIDNGMGVRPASKQFKIPRATLQFKRSNKFIKTGHGPSPILNETEELMSVEWIIDCHEKVFPRRKDNILYSV